MTSVGIVGLGLIGGSLARRLVAHDVEVVAWNHTDRPYADARKDGIVCVSTLEALATAKPEVLFLCNPLKAMPEMLNRLAPVLDRETTTLSDVGSVKAMVRSQVMQAGLGDCYVGAHPMAGTEFSGFGASDPAIYDDALWAVTVDEKTDYQRFLKVATLITGMIGNRIIVLDDRTHDRAAAMISHAPHVVSTAFINELSESPDRNIATALAAGSWRDMTRVALTDPDRTRAMIEEDADNVKVLLRDLADRLNAFADDLGAGDDAALTRFFEAGQPFRDYKMRQRKGDSAESRGIGRLTAGDVAGKVPIACSKGEHIVISVPESAWQPTFLDSARRGEHVIRFIQPWQVEVETRSAL